MRISDWSSDVCSSDLNAIIFANRKTTVRDLAASLKRQGFSTGQIHGDMEQSDRLREPDRFKNVEINILVASDVAARGLDIQGVSHVFNYVVPWHTRSEEHTSELTSLMRNSYAIS